MDISSAFKNLGALRLTTCTIAPLILLGCGGSGSDTPPPNTTSSAMNTGSSTIPASSAGLTSSIASSIANQSSLLNQSSTSNLSSTPNQSSAASQSSTATNDQLVDASDQFTATVNERFFIFKNPSQPGTLHYLPKQLALGSTPGIASIQRTNKVSSLLKVFLDLSETDWTSSSQITFSSRYTLDVDLQTLQQEREAAGYTELVDLKVKPPVINFENRYTTSVPADRIQIQCENLTLLIDGNEVTLQDCNLADTSGIIAAQTINNIGGFRFESLNFDPDTISGNKSLRGTLNIDYTLPGTRGIDQILSTGNGNLQSTWQLYFKWPLTQTTVSSTTITVNWVTLLADLKNQISNGETHWDDQAIKAFSDAAITDGLIVLPNTANLAPALNSAIINYLKQELFVAIYTENSDAPLLWAPKLRFKNVDQVTSQQVTLRHFDSDLSITSKMDLSCLAAPDAQNNIYKSSSCESNPTP
ncbi:MAG TPA: hypothetical protein VL995_01850 [Cellvibrio sp.]|nr:hypothetical protein [Cellvibrio sp.]